jgi:hypothetical protein
MVVVHTVPLVVVHLLVGVVQMIDWMHTVAAAVRDNLEEGIVVVVEEVVLDHLRS